MCYARETAKTRLKDLAFEPVSENQFLPPQPRLLHLLVEGGLVALDFKYPHVDVG